MSLLTGQALVDRATVENVNGGYAYNDQALWYRLWRNSQIAGIPDLNPRASYIPADVSTARPVYGNGEALGPADIQIYTYFDGPNDVRAALGTRNEDGSIYFERKLGRLFQTSTREELTVSGLIQLEAFIAAPEGSANYDWLRDVRGYGPLPGNKAGARISVPVPRPVAASGWIVSNIYVRLFRHPDPAGQFIALNLLVSNPDGANWLRLQSGYFSQGSNNEIGFSGGFDSPTVTTGGGDITWDSGTNQVKTTAGGRFVVELQVVCEDD